MIYAEEDRHTGYLLLNRWRHNARVVTQDDDDAKVERSHVDDSLDGFNYEEEAILTEFAYKKSVIPLSSSFGKFCGWQLKGSSCALGCLPANGKSPLSQSKPSPSR